MDFIMRFWRFAKPTISAVHGYALAAGCELAVACDITVADEKTFFGEPELRFGAGIVAMILPWLTGPKQAKEMILTGNDRITARARPRDQPDQPGRAGRRISEGRDEACARNGVDRPPADAPAEDGDQPHL
jgi:enoyl-CoA hydratase